MRILIDECLPKRLKSHLPGLDVNTTDEMGWTSLENGDLIKAAIENNFSLLLTVDKNLEHQQNIKSFNISVVVFDVQTNKIENIVPLIPNLLEKINTFKSGNVYYLK